MKKNARSGKSKKSSNAAGRTPSQRPVATVTGAASTATATSSAATASIATASESRSTSSRPSHRPTNAPTMAAETTRSVRTPSFRPAAPVFAFDDEPRKLDPDEISIPPAVDLDDVFFHATRTPSTAPVAAHVDEDEPEPIAHKMTARVRARRAHLSKYVKGTVAVAAAVCAMAMIRASVGGAHKGADPTPVAAAEPQRLSVVAPQAVKPAHVEPTVLVDLPPPPAVADVAPAGEAKPSTESTGDVKAADSRLGDGKLTDSKPTDSKPADSKPASTKPADMSAAATTSTKTAAEEKRAARTMLERGKVAAAIEAGERSVALDPTDGEAWLLLGAAYQEKGRPADARKAFGSCLKQGKKGPLGECRAMLR